MDKKSIKDAEQRLSALERNCEDWQNLTHILERVTGNDALITAKYLSNLGHVSQVELTKAFAELFALQMSKDKTNSSHKNSAEYKRDIRIYNRVLKALRTIFSVLIPALRQAEPCKTALIEALMDNLLVDISLSLNSTKKKSC